VRKRGEEALLLAERDAVLPSTTAARMRIATTPTPTGRI